MLSLYRVPVCQQLDGLARPFDEGLAQERRALPAPVHPALLAAALGNRRDAGVLLQFISAFEAVTLLAKRSQQARRQMRTCTGQAVKQVEVGQRPCDCRDLPVEHVDRSERCAVALPASALATGEVQ